LKWLLQQRVVLPDSNVRSRTEPVSGEARRSRPLSGWRLWLGMLLLAITGLITVSLGQWQLSRADEKRAIAQRIQAATELEPLTLSPAVSEENLAEWRQAWARGTWQPGLTVYLDNRNHDGKPGYWVVTPFCLRSPDAPPESQAEDVIAVDCDRAIAVLRGWVPRPAPGADATGKAIPTIPAPVPEPAGDVVQGRLLSHLPRLYELPALMGGAGDEHMAALDWNGSPAVAQNLSLDDYAAASGLDFLPVVLEQHNDTGDGLLREWAGPPVDVDKHLGYAMQWFSFAAIALIALGVILVKALRRNRNR
jgi:surfeit locus 1 family protein